jgi:hypothetical protein
MEQNALAIVGAHAGVEAAHPAKWPGCDSDLRSDRDLATHRWGQRFRQTDEAMPVDHCLEAVDLMVGASCRVIANPNQAQDAEGAVDRPPAIDDPAEKIAGEQRLGCALRLHQRQEHLKAVIHAQPLGGESFALGKAANDAPESPHGRGNCRNAGFGQDRNKSTVASNPLSIGDAGMPLLTDAELAMLHALAAPIDANRRPEFLGAVTTKLEAAGPAAIGPGALHRTARTVLRDFWDPPPDLRQGRLGPRGPRSA